MNGVEVLLSPFRLNKVELPNRVVMLPMTRSFSPSGVPTDDVAAYYRRRAENGVGLIITEATGVARPSSINEPDVPHFHGEAALAGWKRVVDEVHAAGGRIMPQLWHVGSKRSNLGRDWVPPSPYESPSGLALNGEPDGDPLSEADIADIIDAFARAAADAESLGFDGVELHGGHNYLINQFFSSDLNRRTDRYGGETLLARSRFAMEILRAIRQRVTPDFPVLLRLSQWKPHDFTARLADTPDIFEQWLTALLDAGATGFDCSQRRYWEPAFPEHDNELSFAGWAKKLTGAPSILVGSVGLSGDVYETLAGKTFKHASLDPLFARLERGEVDLVGVGRALLQDPAWLEKIRSGHVDFPDFSTEALNWLS
ncbi:NADH:flavin oxidoreductase [Rhizorhabdus phycosphaerae]|uniref:NADH:flavin oxidoreductase n=1 Tax=Rhizorhabdus phycosphaerae TaxID=2711156 RepID=UPI0013EDC4EA|nr:NADH:flavin oxidoreductase [Rhizorhabdus phycosphaerae]